MPTKFSISPLNTPQVISGLGSPPYFVISKFTMEQVSWTVSWKPSASPSDSQLFKVIFQNYSCRVLGLDYQWCSCPGLKWQPLHRQSNTLTTIPWRNSPDGFVIVQSKAGMFLVRVVICVSITPIKGLPVTHYLLLLQWYAMIFAFWSTNS